MANYSEFIPHCSPLAEVVNPSDTKFAESVLISHHLVSRKSALDRRIGKALRVELFSVVVALQDCRYKQ